MARKYYSTQSRRANWYGSKWITKLKRLAIYLRDNFTCVYCAKRLHNAKPKEITLDHILPLDDYLAVYDTADGFNDAHNVATCCKRCNDRKNKRTAEQFLQHDMGTLLLLYVQLALEPNYRLARSILGLNEVTLKQKELVTSD